jgi:hypothetical protein
LILGRGVALVGVLGHRLEHDGFQIGGYCLVDLAHKPRFFDRDPAQELVTVMDVERGLERQELIKGCAQGIEVGAVVHADGPGQGLFRAHVAQRAHEVSGDGQPDLSLAAMSEAEVGDPRSDAADFGSVSPWGDGRTRFDEQVGRLDIAMHDTELMSVFQRKRGLHAQERRRADVRGTGDKSPRGLGRCSGMSIARFRGEVWQAAVFPAAQVLDDRGESLALDILHGVVLDAALAAHAEDGHDVRVVQAGGGPRFVL